MSNQDLFIAALQHDPAERTAFLDQACAGEPALRRQIAVLLKAHDDAGGFLESHPDVGPTSAREAGQSGKGKTEVISEWGAPDAHSPTLTADNPEPGPISERPGSRIGPYKLLQKIGEGGMGTVYMAEQDKPVRRRVALKIIKAGMDTGLVVARFEAERQALAMMDHQNIARVLDAGATDTGRPYFVMELVQGIPITQYCDGAQLNPRERLELIVPVCQAIQHAHQKGIIHRDVKPSNVLVTLYDGKPVAKVIDFGVAKAIEQRLTERTMFTQFGSIVGTLEYMSPEQAQMSALGVDTRSDIYSLGVLLYELLTGTTPLERSKLREAGYAEILRRIKEEEPPKPSTRLSESRDALPSISAHRKTESARLTKLVRGELDWIVMKALEKDRTRRYETANAFARDIERYLADETVEACPPSATYRLRKFARKNRVMLTTVSAFAASLVLGIGISTWQAIVATTERNRAVKAEKQESLERDAAIAERKRAETAEKQAGRERDAAVAERKRADQQRVLAQTVNDFLQNDLLGEAAPQRNARSKNVTVLELLDRSAAKIPGRFDKEPEVEASIRKTIADAYYSLGKLEQAEPHMERALELGRRVLGEEHPDTLNAMADLVALHVARGRFDKAEPLGLKTLELCRRVLGEEHRHTLSSMNNLAGVYRARDKADQAEPLFVKALEIKRRVLGEEHPDTLTMMNNLALLYKGQGKLDQAEPLYLKALEAKRRVLGEEHPDTLSSMNNLAMLYKAHGRFDQAELLFHKTLEAKRRVLGEEHPDTLSSMHNLAALYQEQGKNDEAERLFLKTLDARRRVLGDEHPSTLRSMNDLASLYLSEREYAKAELLLRADLNVRETKQLDAWLTFDTRSRLGASLLGQKKYAEAEPLLLAGYEGLKASEAKIPATSRNSLPDAGKRVVQLYDAWGQPKKAAEWRKKLGLVPEFPTDPFAP